MKCWLTLGMKETSEAALDQGKNTIINALESANSRQLASRI